jgi:murein DD-endopeptidase MepM/ murein hydrolase activator NlpD
MPIDRIRPVGFLAMAVILLPLAGASAAPRTGGGTLVREAPAYGTYEWPVRGPVISTFEQPATPYGPGHRGIDIAAPLGSPVRAAGPGRVAFAGWVAGSLFVSIDHPDGVRTTYSWLSAVSVTAGDQARTGQVIGATGSGHPGRVPPHLHFGARVADVYVDPLLLLGEGSLVGLIHLAPFRESLDAMVSRIGVHGPREPPARRSIVAASLPTRARR